MIAAPDAYELTVEERVERMARRRYGQDIQDLFFAQDAAEVAKSMQFQELGYCSPLDWIKKETKRQSRAVRTRSGWQPVKNALIFVGCRAMLPSRGLRRPIHYWRLGELAKDSCRCPDIRAHFSACPVVHPTCASGRTFCERSCF